ncbi:MAG TPA: diaminopimelate epimerase, partial [Ruminococcus sp.]|nr:diaminopimelate epimerase [Ruminococcus sp.]
GACAAAVASVLNGYCKREQEILIHLRGGDLRIIYHNDESVTMIGPATFIFEGKMEY